MRRRQGGDWEAARLLHTRLGWMPAGVSVRSAPEDTQKPGNRTADAKSRTDIFRLMICSAGSAALSHKSHPSLWLSLDVRSLLPHLGESKRIEELHNELFIRWADWQVQSCTVCLIWSRGGIGLAQGRLGVKTGASRSFQCLQNEFRI